MAMDCGHYEKSKETQKKRLEAGVCPTCNVLTNDSHLQVLPHATCICCETCWVIVDDEVKILVHG